MWDLRISYIILHIITTIGSLPAYPRKPWDKVLRVITTDQVYLSNESLQQELTVIQFHPLLVCASTSNPYRIWALPLKRPQGHTLLLNVHTLSQQYRLSLDNLHFPTSPTNKCCSGIHHPTQTFGVSFAIIVRRCPCQHLEPQSSQGLVWDPFSLQVHIDSISYSPVELGCLTIKWCYKAAVKCILAVVEKVSLHAMWVG